MSLRSHSRRALRVLGAGAAAAVALWGCRGEAPARHNVILVSIDTLRPDHLGCYGYDRPTSPGIDGFRRGSVLFSDAVAHAPSTLPSHASILTSLLPQHHGASVANNHGLSPEVVSLAEVLKAEGYATASFNGGIQLDPLYGLDQGFDLYVSARPSLATAEVLVDPIDKFAHVIDSAIGWLERERPERFFLFLHTYEVHHPYTPDDSPAGLFDTGYSGQLPRDISVQLLQSINAGEVQADPEDVEHIISRYDAEIRSVDASFTRFVEYLEAAGLYDDALIIFTSDHGEEFGEHGRVGWHTHSLFDELLKVPLILKLPQGRYAGLEVRDQARGIDVAPTVLALLGLSAPSDFAGQSLLPLLEGPTLAVRPTLSARDVTLPNRVVSIRRPPWKWYDGRLYHLESDRREQVDVSAGHQDVARELEETLRAALASRERTDPVEVQPDPQLLRRLRALGYVE